MILKNIQTLNLKFINTGKLEHNEIESSNIISLIAYLVKLLNI